jgi:hypothetical protein
MGGGLFGTSFYLNLKCLVFSLVIVAIYYLPHPFGIAHNLVMSFLLACSAYIALAWYDVIYSCQDRLKPTFLGWLTKGFKPPEYGEAYDKLPLKEKKIIRVFDIAVLSVLVLTFIYPFVFTGVNKMRK